MHLSLGPAVVAVVAVVALSVSIAVVLTQTIRLPPPAVTAPGSLVLQHMLSGLGEITDIQNAGDDRLFVVTRTGQIQAIQIDPRTGDIVGNPTLFLNVSNVVATTLQNEQGLLGLAFHPNYTTNGHFFVNYISSLYSSPSKTVISRFTVNGDPKNVSNVANAKSEVVIAEIKQADWNHNGGQMHFWGANLYIATGDGGSYNDHYENAQNGTSLLGKMLRVNVDNLTSSTTLPRWTIPADNPFVKSETFLHEIWAYGLRNPWRFSFDRHTGDMWIGDVGQAQREEVDFQPANSTGGENYGWGCCEGFRRNTDYNGTGCGNDCAAGNSNNYVAPAFDYNHSIGSSITGGYVYRGKAFPALYGTYFYADFAFGTLWGARPNGLGRSTQDFISIGPASVSNPTTFGEDKNGELYLGTLDGALYRVTAAATPTSAPTIAPPPTSMPPVFTPQPNDYVNCPPVYDESIELSPGLYMSYAVRTPQDSASLTAYGGVLCVQIVSNQIGWIGFASSLDGFMPGSEAVIGRLDDDNLPTGIPNPGKRYLVTRSPPDELMPLQTLIGATIVKNITSQTTTLTFTKILIEQGEIPINARGNNTFLWARGSGDTSFDFHDEKGTVSLEFCLVDDDCNGGTQCNPRVCTSSFTCQDGPSPCK